MRVHNSQNLINRRRELRSRLTKEEGLLWQELRNNKLGHRFRRQHSIGGYILDFYCAKRRLVIEIDGPIHEFQKEYDEIRDKYFKELVYRVLRFKNEDIRGDMQKVIQTIKNSL